MNYKKIWRGTLLIVSQLAAIGAQAVANQIINTADFKREAEEFSQEKKTYALDDFEKTSIELEGGDIKYSRSYFYILEGVKLWGGTPYGENLNKHILENCMLENEYIIDKITLLLNAVWLFESHSFLKMFFCAGNPIDIEFSSLDEFDNSDDD